MGYATETQLLDQFGEEEIAQVADEGSLVTGALLRLTVDAGDRSAYSADEIAAADTALAQIQTAMTNADGLIDSYLSAKYALPLDTTPAQLTAVSLDIARYRLYDDRATEQVQRRFDEAIAWLKDIAKGVASLPIAAAGESTGPVESTSTEDDRLFTMDTLADY